MSVRRVAIAGLGSIGLPVAKALDKGINGLQLVAVSARNEKKVRANLKGFCSTVEFLPLDDLAMSADIVVECAPAAVFDRIAGPVIEAGGTLLPLSVGALLERGRLIERAKETRARIVIPSGAIVGLDAIKGASEGTIHSVLHITRKPPKSLAGAPYLAQNGISLEGLDGPLMVFKGTARQGALHFPANVNVSAAVSLAGIGPDRTQLEVWADPALERNMHRVVVEADSARFTIEIENVPSTDTPGTGRLTPLSVIATLRGLTSPLRVGT